MTDMKVVNLTPHPIGLYIDGSLHTNFMPYETQLRLDTEEQTPLAPLNADGVAIPVVTPPSFKPIIDWPKIEGCDAVLVSMPVGQLVQSHPECVPPYKVFGPDTGPDNVVRDGGRILGTTRFIQYH